MSRTPLDLARRTALVTGAGRGIGAASARLLAERGARVVLVDQDREAVTAAATSIGRGAIPLVADVRDGDAMAAVFEEAATLAAPVDVVLANAGVTPPPATTRTISPTDFHRVLDINITGVFNTVKPALAQVIASKGHIHITASAASFAPGVGGAAYMMSKAAVEQFGRALRLELAAHGASVGTTYYGVVETDMARETLEDNPLGPRIGNLLKWPLNVRITPEEAARTMVDAVERRRPRSVAPWGWAPYSTLRGVVNPAVDAFLARSGTIHQLLEDVEEQSLRNQAAASAPAPVRTHAG